MKFRWLILLAMPLSASGEELVGTWERDVGDTPVGYASMQIVFNADSTFETHQFIQVDNDHFFFLSARKENPLLPLIDVFSAHATGTFSVNGEQMVVNLTDSYLLLDGDSFADYFTKVGRQLARFIANQEEIPDEEYDEFEQLIIDDYLKVVNEKKYCDVFSKAQNVDDPSLDMDFHVPCGAQSLHGRSYLIDGDTLVLGDETVYSRTNETLDIPTASISMSSWGAIKHGHSLDRNRK